MKSFSPPCTLHPASSCYFTVSPDYVSDRPLTSLLPSQSSSSSSSALSSTIVAPSSATVPNHNHNHNHSTIWGCSDHTHCGGGYSSYGGGSVGGGGSSSSCDGTEALVNQPWDVASNLGFAAASLQPSDHPLQLMESTLYGEGVTIPVYQRPSATTAAQQRQQQLAEISQLLLQQQQQQQQQNQHQPHPQQLPPFRSASTAASRGGYSNTWRAPQEYNQQQQQQLMQQQQLLLLQQQRQQQQPKQLYATQIMPQRVISTPTLPAAAAAGRQAQQQQQQQVFIGNLHSQSAFLSPATALQHVLMIPLTAADAGALSMAAAPQLPMNYTTMNYPMATFPHRAFPALNGGGGGGLIVNNSAVDRLALHRQNHLCKLCDVICFSDEQMRRHLRGKKHEKKLKDREYRTLLISDAPPETTLEHIQVFLADYHLDLVSTENHALDCIDTAEGRVFRAVLASVEEIQRCLSILAPTATILSQRVTLKPTSMPLFCEACQMELNSEFQMTEHMQGKQHLRKSKSATMTGGKDVEVLGLSPDVTEADVAQFFAEFQLEQPPADVMLLPSMTGGVVTEMFCVVTFHSKEEAQRTVALKNGQRLRDSQVTLCLTSW